VQRCHAHPRRHVPPPRPHAPTPPRPHAPTPPRPHAPLPLPPPHAIVDTQGIAAGCDNASYEIWDTACNQQIARGKVKKGRCESIAVSSSGRFTYTGWDNAELYIADTLNPENQKQQIADAHTESVSAISLSLDGSCLASGGFDNKVKLWTGPK
jgi:WD40 repeat protein